jgi:hypothetical protein
LDICAGLSDGAVPLIFAHLGLAAAAIVARPAALIFGFVGHAVGAPMLFGEFCIATTTQGSFVQKDACQFSAPDKSWRQTTV